MSLLPVFRSVCGKSQGRVCASWKLERAQEARQHSCCHGCYLMLLRLSAISTAIFHGPSYCMLRKTLSHKRLTCTVLCTISANPYPAKNCRSKVVALIL